MADAPPRVSLTVAGLTVRAGGRVLVDRVDLRLEPGEIVALVGASGSGKSMTARALMGMVRAQPGVVGGEVRVDVGDTSLSLYHQGARPRRPVLQQLRGPLLGLLPQDARASLDPLWTVARQVEEVRTLRTAQSSAPVPQVHHWLAAAGFGAPDRIAGLYPHQLSGGMAQRVCIALALARGSRLLIADEPTTGLDPTIQSGILAELRRLSNEGLGVLFITHDLRLVPGFADRVLVMHDGAIVERFAASGLQTASSGPATALIEATRRIAGGAL